MAVADHSWTEEHWQEDYNLLRQNGAIYSLGLSYLRTPRDDMNQAMIRGVDYLKTDALHPVPDVTQPGKFLPGLEHIQPNTTPLQQLRAIGNFIIRKMGALPASTCTSMASDKWQSLYYPGEAALGLLTLAEIDVEEGEKWLVVATKTFLYLENLRRYQPLGKILNTIIGHCWPQHHRCPCWTNTIWIPMSWSIG